MMKMNEIKVYIAAAGELKDDVLFGELYHTVSRERQEKIDRFMFPKDKRLSLGAGVLLAKALAAQGIDRYELCYGQNGKPYVKDTADAFFNLSHSEEMLMCAVSHKEVGCDVEKVTDISPEIAKRFFFSTEYDAIMEKQSREEQNDMFFRLWTLKESFMKVTGLGMKLGLDSFRIDIREEEVSVRQSIRPETYYFKEYDLGNGYKYAACGLVPQFAEPEFVSFNKIKLF